MKNNRTITLIHLTTSLKIGGAETLLVDVVRGLSAHNFEQHIICFYDGPHAKRLRNLGVSVHLVKGLFFLYDPVFFVRLLLLIRSLRPDCIHSLLWSANFMGRLVAHLARIPIICAMHNNYDQNGFIRAILDRLTIKRSDKFIAVSYEVKNSILNRLPQIAESSINIITNGIDPSQCCSLAKKLKDTTSDIKFSDNNFVIGSVGRLVSIKNYAMFLDYLRGIIAYYPNVRFLLVGTGPEEFYLKKKIKLCNLEEHVVMIINKPAMAYYSLFDCFVLPSFKEGISIALLEAMSFSLPCIVGNHSPKHSVIKHGSNGLIVTPDDDFTQAILSIIEDKVLRQRLSKRARETVESDFHVNNMIKSYVDQFHCLSNSI